MKKAILYQTLFFLLLFNTLQVDGQENSNPIKLNGNISLNYDNYSASTVNYNNFRARYPDNLLQLNANATIHFGKYFSIPFGVNISNQKTSYIIPAVLQENFFDYVQNPRNNIHIDPTYKWITGHFGSHTPNYSLLTTVLREVVTKNKYIHGVRAFTTDGRKSKISELMEIEVLSLKS